MKKKRKKQKNKVFTKKQLENLVLSIFKENPLKQLNYKQLSKILKIKELGLKILLNDVMISLSKSGILKEEKRGSFKLIQTTKKVIGVINTSINSGVYLDVEGMEEEIFVLYLMYLQYTEMSMVFLVSILHLLQYNLNHLPKQ